MTVVPVTLSPGARVRTLLLNFCILSNHFHQELYDTVEQLSKERIEGLLKASSDQSSLAVGGFSYCIVQLFTLR
jgi:hypothetical protein